jgi:hypothetical protein
MESRPRSLLLIFKSFFNEIQKQWYQNLTYEENLLFETFSRKNKIELKKLVIDQAFFSSTLKFFTTYGSVDKMLMFAEASTLKLLKVAFVNEKSTKKL